MDTEKEAREKRAKEVAEKVHIPFRPSPTKVVKFVNKEGKVVEERRMNRAERRRLKIR